MGVLVAALLEWLMVPELWLLVQADSLLGPNLGLSQAGLPAGFSRGHSSLCLPRGGSRAHLGGNPEGAGPFCGKGEQQDASPVLSEHCYGSGLAARLLQSEVAPVPPPRFQALVFCL